MPPIVVIATKLEIQFSFWEHVLFPDSCQPAVVVESRLHDDILLNRECSMTQFHMHYQLRWLRTTSVLAHDTWRLITSILCFSFCQIATDFNVNWVSAKFAQWIGSELFGFDVTTFQWWVTCTTLRFVMTHNVDWCQIPNKTGAGADWFWRWICFPDVFSGRPMPDDFTGGIIFLYSFWRYEIDLLNTTYWNLLKNVK